jgi:transposase-like protein
MAKRARKRYSPEKKAQILAAAKAQGLTANDVKKKFGVTPVTYYSWRKKSGAGKPRGRGPARGNAGLDSSLEKRVQARLRTILPRIVNREIDAYLASLGGGRRRRG